MNIASLYRLAKTAVRIAKANPAIVAGAIAVGRKVVKKKAKPRV